jgi:uncharacterized protein (DUF1800 family)
MQRLQHLLWRTGFGPAVTDWSKWSALPESTWWTRIKNNATSAPEYLDVADNAVKGLLMGAKALGEMEQDALDKEQKKKLRQQSRDDLQTLNLQWMEEMVHSPAQLREKTALFWHGHFASRNINILYQQQLLHVIRTHALGNFKNLLREISKSAAMLAFLNNQQNKKKHPNENFAREVMELFTLGRGHYTETDVKEAARAFTGWGYRLNGEFVFRKWDHDTGEKTILGKTGHFNGDDVLDILLEQKQTAHFIARKIYRFFVHETNVPDDRINWLGDRFYDSGYKITQVLDDIFTSDWFYAPENRGNKIKSPVELLVGIRRMMPLQMEDPNSQILIQKALGQVLFYPPNVAGWPGGKNWIDSSSLMLRLRLPQLLAQQGEWNTRTKDDDDLQMGEKPNILSRQKRLAAEINWAPILKRFQSTKDQDRLLELASALWQCPLNALPKDVLEKHIDARNLDTSTKSAWILLMATPEYQLC